ncbi:MAG TPA: hypothetical protein VMH88_04500 [Gemmatimonadales bacterium]|nr:hypothetical protein [Gemmatimonadales bacterium]
MLRKLGAVVLAVGLCLPYGCDVRPITGVWSGISMIAFLGIPVLLGVVYVLLVLVPPVAEALEQRGQGIHGLLRLCYFVLAGAYLAMAITKSDNWPGPIDVAVMLVVTGALFYWEQGRGTKAARVPLLLLMCLGVPEVAYLTGFLREGGLQYGGIVLTAGWLVALLAETRVLAGAPRIAHGG